MEPYLPDGKSLSWYRDILPTARAIARRQGFHGVRWPKMTGPGGVDSPSSVGSFLIWQQPHIIYLAELCYRDRPDSVTLRKFQLLVEATADFMADYAFYDTEKGYYTLGPWLIPAQERLPAETTVNPPFELAYWYWGLSTAQAWRERQGLPRVEKWDHVLGHLPLGRHRLPLPGSSQRPRLLDKSPLYGRPSGSHRRLWDASPLRWSIKH